MSTEHHGEYCSKGGKMVLERTEAASMAGRMGGMSTYKCEHCGGWHLATSNHDGKKWNRTRRRERRWRRTRRKKD